MKKLIHSVLIFSLTIVFFSCSSNDKYQIAKGKVGHLTQKTTIKDLDQIFKNDSIVKNLSEGSLGSSYFQDDDEYKIYEKGGKHLLTIVPKDQLDSISTIKSIQIFDERFKTESGINLTSNFSQINLNNEITKIETSLNSATLFIDDLNATIAIDKEELGLRKFTTQKVNLDQIPDLAKIKSFIIWFN
ncbi:MAG: hypothetical protein JXQ93_09210 [Flavobacteriaceae bacterium]